MIVALVLDCAFQYATARSITVTEAWSHGHSTLCCSLRLDAWACRAIRAPATQNTNNYEISISNWWKLKTAWPKRIL
jgi:hypothetical protein